MNLIELKDVTKIYHTAGNEVIGCDSITLNISQGEMLGIMGPSGMGKSTLLHIIGGLDSFDSGSYLLKGKEMKSLGKKELARLRNTCFGFVLQDFGLLLGASVRDNLEVPLVFNPNVSMKEINEKIHQALELVHMEEMEKRLVSQLSGGQKQRIAIARAMINQPEILLCDEPTGALDQKTAQDIVTLLSDINKKGTTVLIVTHDTNVAQRCERVIRIVDGKIN